MVCKVKVSWYQHDKNNDSYKVFRYLEVSAPNVQAALKYATDLVNDTVPEAHGNAQWNGYSSPEIGVTKGQT